MNWFHTPPSSAAEVCASRWTLVLADQHDASPGFAGAATFETAHENLVNALNEFRTGHRLAADTSVVLWPAAGDAGVASVDERTVGVVTLPKARAIRERVEPLVRAGGRVQALWLPHEAIEAMAAVAGWESGAVLALHAHGACLAALDGARARATYVHWEPFVTRDMSESSRMLARYQLVSRVVPHVRRCLDGVTGPVVVCGSVPDLRLLVVPLVEELDREVDVLDTVLIGQPSVELDPAEIPALQIAWAAAAARQRRAAQRR